MMVSNSLNNSLGPAGYLEQALRDALAHDEFFLQYQPYHNLSTHDISGVEALIRWQHPMHGLIYPDHFIPSAERSELIDALGVWVLRESCRQMGIWCAAGLDIPSISVNVSPRQFNSSSLPILIQTTLTENHLAANQLDLEITESVLPSDEKMMYANISALRDLGVKISIDDFGMGYSNLQRLRMMQIDRIKIDRIFIEDLALNPRHSSLVRSMIHLAKELGVSIIAEGIEDSEAFVRLQSMGCDQGQGFYFTAALNATECENYVRMRPRSLDSSSGLPKRQETS